MEALVTAAAKLVGEIMTTKATHPAHQETYERHPWVRDHDIVQFTGLLLPFVPDGEREEFKERVVREVHTRMQIPRAAE